MTSWVKRSARRVLSLLIAARLNKLLVSILSRLAIRPLAVANDGQEATTILVLAPELFRDGELDHLAHSGHFNILSFSELWLVRILQQFYAADISMSSLARYANPQASDPAHQAKREYRQFLTSLLPHLYRRLGINCVLGHHVHYIPGMDIGSVSDELGYPFLVFHREGLLASRAIQRNVKERLSGLGKFEGTHVAVHNEIVARNFADSGYVPEHLMTVLGAFRMDGFLNQLSQRSPATLKRQAVLFAFMRSGLLGAPADDFYDGVYEIFARVAMDVPDAEFIIKCKIERTSSWRKKITEKLLAAGIDPKSIPNLKIVGCGSPHRLIIESSVVSSFNSTTLLEAAIAGKRVIYPFFGGITDPRNRDVVYFDDDLDDFDEVFEVARCREDYAALIRDGLDNPTGVPRRQSKARDIFEKYISSLSGGSTDAYVRLIQHYVRRASSVSVPGRSDQGTKELAVK